MNINDRIGAFAELGEFVKSKLVKIDTEEKAKLFRKAEQRNPWFISPFISEAIGGVCSFLDYETLQNWMKQYSINEKESKTVGLVLAGNIPMVGFHDILSVLMSGHKAQVKLSGKDDVLLPYLFSKLIEIEPAFHEKIEFRVTPLKNYDAIIATGSNNASRYFEYYFGKVANIIRRNRTSVAIIKGDETNDELRGLVKDMLLYFGLGCRNVTKIFIPEGFDIRELYTFVDEFEFIKQHNKYFNNYEYNRSVLLVNRIKHYDNDYLIFKEDEVLFSPISVVFYQTYKNYSDVSKILEENESNIQCIVTKENIFKKNSVNPGKAQYPAIDDYADNVDTMAFLSKLN